MTSLMEWTAGARPRTLPAALAPVLAGTGIAIAAGSFQPLLATLALVVSVALQIGVNYANDYSDGIRGTDDNRVGPMRLVGSGAATPSAVKRAAFACFGVAAVAGLVIVVLTQMWWLLAVGVAAIAAAWFYTGGKRPYGYLGLGELFVFIFFGLVAVIGTTVIQTRTLGITAVVAGCSIGALACAILVANNLRDLDGDAAVGKRTLATRLGDAGTRKFFLILLVIPGLGVGLLAAWVSPWCLLGLIFTLLAGRAASAVMSGARGPQLIAVLKQVGMAELVCSVGILAGCVAAFVTGGAQGGGI